MKSLFQKVGTTKIVPISLKVLIVFVSLLLLSNFATNFVNLRLSRRQIINLSNTVMVSQLKDIFSAASNQYQIFTFTGDKTASVEAIRQTARRGFEMPNSIALAFDRTGKLLFCTLNTTVSEEEAEQAQERPPLYLDENSGTFPDAQVLDELNAQFDSGKKDGSILFQSQLGQYYGVYKFQDDWGCYFVRAELRKDTMKTNEILLGIISLLILGLVLAFLVAGLFMFKKIMENIKRITKNLYDMQEKQKLDIIDLSSSPNDDITYLAASFNALSSRISNLLSIFQKFVSKDVVAKAYTEHQILLEGNRRNLVMLFSDIKSFTYRTETLGNDIIDLLNVHYDKVIHTVHGNSGVIGSIIGDAILAIYGTQKTENKSLDSLKSAWQITKVTAQLREKMIARKAEIEKKRTLTESEERVFRAVLIDIGVGIDGGNVFYGNIGSDEHMTNTVIGDNVNSASRLEGLTRIYHLPIIVSEYIKDEIDKTGERPYRFYEIDTVQVKGKTEGKKIYFPLEIPASSGEESRFELYENALSSYYSGDWDTARAQFRECGIEAAEVFLERMGTSSAPKNWSGIWTMQTK